MPCLTIFSSLVKMPTAPWGNRLTRARRSAAMASAAQKATAISLRTGSVFFRPQYWLASTTIPLLIPKMSCWRMN